MNTKIEELENTVEDRLAQLADKTRAEVDSRLVSVEGRVEDNAEENKLIVQKFGNQQDSIDKIFTDISAHSSVLEEMLVLKVTFYGGKKLCLSQLNPRRLRWPGWTVWARTWRRRSGSWPGRSTILT